ncbi:hypothetical protein GCM10022395_19960 [Snuella lapsa]|uniref:Uncharacterized protein n=2 Tax=Snuella lapsa TaxID=870481 RepID=A0ABP6XP74_9FLAO
MKKQVINKERLVVKGVLPVDDSFVYEIDEKREGRLYEFEYRFSHFNWSKNQYMSNSNYKPPLIIKKDTSFLKTISVLDIDFFKSTDYLKVCKTFEDEDSWKQDVLIFIIDIDEIVDDKIVLREVQFSRPVKQ